MTHIPTELYKFLISSFAVIALIHTQTHKTHTRQTSKMIACTATSLVHMVVTGNILVGTYALCGLQSHPYTTSGCWYFITTLPSRCLIMLRQKKQIKTYNRRLLHIQYLKTLWLRCSFKHLGHILTHLLGGLPRLADYFSDFIRSMMLYFTLLVSLTFSFWFCAADSTRCSSVIDCMVNIHVLFHILVLDMNETQSVTLVMPVADPVLSNWGEVILGPLHSYLRPGNLLYRSCSTILITGSQCKSSTTGMMWSHRCTPDTIPAAMFCTH